MTNTTKSKPPRLPFRSMKEAVLGEDYTVSLVFVGGKRSRDLNLAYRNKDASTNILSFPLDKDTGEIFIDLSKSKKEAHLFERSYDNFIAFLFIHGLFHLKGYDHGSTMERKEREIRKKFNI